MKYLIGLGSDPDNKSGCSSDATDDPSAWAGARDGEGKSARENWRSRVGTPAPASLFGGMGFCAVAITLYEVSHG